MEVPDSSSLPGWPAHNLCLLAAQSQWVQMFTSHSHRVSEGSEGWFSRTWGPQIWLCPAVAEGKQSALTFQSENSDKSDVLSCWDCCHTIGRMSTSHIGNVKVFFAAPCSYVTRSLVWHPLTSLCVHFNAHLFPHSCIKLSSFFQKSTTIFLWNENVFLSSNVHLIF